MLPDLFGVGKKYFGRSWSSYMLQHLGKQLQIGSEKRVVGAIYVSISRSDCLLSMNYPKLHPFLTAAMNDSSSLEAPVMVLHWRCCILTGLITVVRSCSFVLLFIRRFQSHIDLNMRWLRRRRKDGETAEWASGVLG